jgi:predicted esterase YcpF (UPF0227 family)
MNRIIYLHGFASGPGSSKARFFRERLERIGAAVEVPDLAAGDFEHLTITGHVNLEVLDSGHELLNVLDYVGTKVERFLPS